MQQDEEAIWKALGGTHKQTASDYVWFIEDDWQGLYKNGKLVMENHSLHPFDLAKELGIELHAYEDRVEHYLMEHGSFPMRLDTLQLWMEGIDDR